MPLPQVSAKTPTSIGTIIVTLTDKPAMNEEPAIKGARYHVIVMDQDSDHMATQEGNLVPHLSQSDVDWLLDFMTRMRAKAIAELIP